MGTSIVWSALGWTSNTCPAPPLPTKMLPPSPMPPAVVPLVLGAPPVPFEELPPVPPVPPHAATLAAATRTTPRPAPQKEKRSSMVERYSGRHGGATPASRRFSARQGG